MAKRVLLLAVMIVLVTNFAFPQSSFDFIGRDKDKNNNPMLNTITTAVPFLLIAPDSRSGAMGDVGAATSADPSSQHHNPSKYVFNKNKIGFSISYSPWLQNLVGDIHLLYLAGYYKITDLDAIAFSLRYFSLGEIIFADEHGITTSQQKPNEFALDFTYSRKLIDQLSIAITPRFIYSDLTASQYANDMETKPGISGAADLSLFYEQDFSVKSLYNSTLRAGLNISNLGNKMTYTDNQHRDFLPANLKLGIGYEMAFDEYNSLAIITEFNKLLVPTPPINSGDTNEYGQYIYYGKDNNVSVAQGIFQSFSDAPYGFKEEMQEINIGVGLEYAYRNLLFVRLGYFYENKNKGNRQFFTIGAGIKYNIIGVDMSYLFTINQNHPLENTLRFSLTFDFVSFDKGDIKKQGKLN